VRIYTLKNIANEIYYLIHLISSLSSLIDDDKEGRKKKVKKGRKNYESDIEMDDGIWLVIDIRQAEKEIEF
jgi:hypothetical protein